MKAWLWAGNHLKNCRG